MDDNKEIKPTEGIPAHQAATTEQEDPSQRTSLTLSPDHVPMDKLEEDSNANNDDLTKKVTHQSMTAEERSVANHPVGLKLYLITLSLMLAVFCVALDNTIIATAIPRITDQFHALNDVGWYGSSYLLTTCAFQLLFGKFYTFFNIKWVFLTALFIFELGSLVCGVAPTSTALIVGRAVAGLGSAGIFTGALVTIANTVPLHKRPLYLGLVGGMYGIASVAGPLMGGAFTDHLTWRWCFYINLPIGGVTAAGILFLLQLPTMKMREEKGFFKVLMQLDPIGTSIFVPCIICLLLALQWGGSTYAWSNGRIIALFVIFGVLLIVWVALQIRLKDAATIPVRIATQRSIAFGALFSFCIGASFFIVLFYIPIWFQAINGTSAVRSGIDNLPLILANVIAIIFSGGLTTKIGYYTQWIIASSVIMSIGAGLLTTFTVDMSTSRWIGYEILYGFGVGLGFQQTATAAQTILPFADISIGTAFVLFIQLLGGALFVSVAQNIFTTHLIANLTALNIPNFDPQVVVNAGATTLRQVVDPARLPEVLVAYNEAITKTFQIALIMSCLSVLGAVGMEWKSVKGKMLAAGAA